MCVGNVCVGEVHLIRGTSTNGSGAGRRQEAAEAAKSAAEAAEAVAASPAAPMGAR